jgi:hypothetical protein
MSTDDLTATLAALDALHREIEAVGKFDQARDAVVDLIEVRADPEAIMEALDAVYKKLEVIRDTYYRLERLMVASGWSMERPSELPSALRAALDAQVPHHQEHLAHTARAEEVIGAWLNEENQQGYYRRYRASRRFSEEAHARRARRRRRG